MKRYILAALCIALLFAGCGGNGTAPAGKTALTPVAPEQAAMWQLAERISETGEGNSARVLQTAGTAPEQRLELAAGNTGTIEYKLEEPADIAAFFSGDVEFLSTQGTGQVVLTALDATGGEIARLGTVFTGALPPQQQNSQWQDKRYVNNYEGRWESLAREPEALFTAAVPGFKPAMAARYRLTVKVGQGQHALIKGLTAGLAPAKAVELSAVQPAYAAVLGDTLTVEARLTNHSRQPIDKLTVRCVEPEGYGYVVVGAAAQEVTELLPGETRGLSWTIKAQRPDTVNFTKTWPVRLAVEDRTFDLAKLAVRDPGPGTVYYVMTEDLEPIDSAGYAKAWGNANGWLDPEEFTVQLVQKAERLNAIAEQHGAKWTHYTAWPAVKAAEWAAGQSTTGKWQQATLAIRQSVTEQSRHGHEYALHMHSDYDPELPGNVLSYNAAVDGLWANHLHHGWAHSVVTEGDFSDGSSRAGILYTYQRIMEELSADSGQGQLITTRAGSFDIGNGNADEQMSTNAYRKVGLWGSSDADGNLGGSTSGAYGQEIYFTKADDINRPAGDFKEIGLVEFRPTPKPSIAYDTDTAAVMNEKADQGMRAFMTDGQIKPGIHLIDGFTHAMFMLGNGDWRSLEGGQFQALDEHLAYLAQTYAEKGLLRFATASELVRAYIDYYTPNLQAVYGARLSDSFGVSEYAVQLLGKTLPSDAAHRHTVTLKYPLYLRDSAYRISVLKNGQPIMNTWGLPTPYNDIVFTVDDTSATYTLKVYHNPLVFHLSGWLHSVRQSLVPHQP